MKIAFFILAAALAMAGGITCFGQSKTWTGAGDGLSWTNQSNWSGGTLPDPSDMVAITSGAGTRVVIAPGNDITVQSIQCTKGFVVSGGSLTLTAGNSQFSGPFILTNGATLSIDGSGATVTASATTLLADAWLYASGGAEIHLPNLYSVSCLNNSPTWQVTGSGSTIDLSSVTNLTMDVFQVLYIQGLNGGQVDLHRLNNPTGVVQVSAQDAGTVVDLSGLTGRWKSTANNAISLLAKTDGSILIPNVTQLENASLEVDDTGVIPTAQLNLLTNCTLTADGAAPDLSSLTNIDDTWVYVYNGGLAQLANVKRVTYGNRSPTWDAEGAGSAIDLSSVTNFTAGVFQVLYIEGHDGGQVDLHRLRDSTGAVQVNAQGTGTVVNLNGLTGRWKSAANSPSSVRAQTGGSIIISNVTQLENAALGVDDTGVIPTAQLNLLTNCTLTADGSVPNLSSLTNIDDTWVYVYDGGVARLTNVKRVTEGNYNPTWHAEGAGSLIDLSSVTTITMGEFPVLYVEGRKGGQVDLHRLNNPAGAVQVSVQDGGTVVNLNGLAGRWKSAAPSANSLRAQTSGSILIPNVTQLENASLEVDDTGVISTAQLNLLTNCTLTVDGSAPNFGGLTNIDDTWVYAYDGGVARLANVKWVTEGNHNATWHADGTNSLIDVSGVLGISVGAFETLYVEAFSGGKVDLHGLVALSTGPVQVTADGVVSVIDLSGLSGFISTGNGSSSLTAKNSGTVLLGTQAFLLCNVEINIPPGNPVLPPTLAASSTLTLYGQAWHSYWVDMRDTTSPLNPWVFAARVPLTNSLQPLALTIAQDTEYQVWEFVANPPILDLFPAANHHSLLIVYDTPGMTNQIIKTSSLTNGTTWANDVVTIMTNSFRNLGTTSNSYPMRFFRAKRL